MFCSKCGRKNKDGKYCSFCGSLLNKNVLDFESTKTLLRSNIRLEDLPNNDEQLDRSINDGNKISAQENLHTSSESAIYTAFFDSVENAEHTAESEDNISSIGYSIKRVNSKSETFEQTKTEVNEDPSFAILAETEIDSSAETVQSEESVFVENADIEEEPLFANITSEEFEAANLPTIDEDEDITYDTFAETVTESSTETVQNEEYVSAANTEFEEEPLFANITSEEFEAANIPTVDEDEDIAYDTFAEIVTESSTETVQNVEPVSAENTDEPLFANITSEEFEVANIPSVEEAQDITYDTFAETVTESSTETVQNEEPVSIENTEFEEEPLFANITSEEFEAANLPTVDEDEDITYDTFAETVTESYTETVQREEPVSIENTEFEEEPLFANITSEEFEAANLPTVDEDEDITYDTFAETVTESSTETVQNEEYVSAENTEFEEKPLFANITSEEFEAANISTVDEDEDITYDTFAETVTESSTETVQREESVSIENADIEEEPLYEENFVSKEIIDEDKTFSFSSTDVSSVEEKQEQTESNISEITLNEREISQADKPSFTASGYSDIDPMFGPPPTMNFTVTVKPQETEKKSFFKNKFKKNKSKE